MLTNISQPTIGEHAINRDLASTEDHIAVRRELESVRDQLHHVSQMRDRAERNLELVQEQIQALQAKHTDLESQIESARQERDRAQNERDEALHDLKEVRQEKNEVWQWLNKANAKLEHISSPDPADRDYLALVQQIEAAHQQNQALLSSTSWKITAPIRALKDLVKW